MDRVSDTSADARRVQLEILRRMTGPDRVALAFEMSDEVRSLSEAGIRHRHPDWADAKVHAALLSILLGRDVAEKVLRERLVRA
jgi:hypothetical protein